MKKVTLFLFPLLFCANLLFSQTTESPWALELSVGTGHFNSESNYYLFGGIGVNRYLTSSLDVSVQATYGTFKYTDLSDVSQTGKKQDASLLLRYKLNNGTFLPLNSAFVPFLTGGVGLASCTGQDLPAGTKMIIPIGGGVRFRLSSRLSIQYQLLFNLKYDYTADNFEAGKSDYFMKHALGLVILLGKTKKYNSKCHCND